MITSETKARRPERPTAARRRTRLRSDMFRPQRARRPVLREAPRRAPERRRGDDASEGRRARGPPRPRPFILSYFNFV